jgi:hypothetical protein
MADTEIKIEPGQFWTSDGVDDGWGTAMILDPVEDPWKHSASYWPNKHAWWILDSAGRKVFIWESVLKLFYTPIPSDGDNKDEDEGSNRV